jgi:hypothetical protein
MRTFFIALALACFTGTACHPPKDEVLEPSSTPPLPPASGTAIGYLVDASADLNLTPDQAEKLHKIDDRLAAQNGPIDTQLRDIEKPVPAEELSPQQMKAGVKEQRYDKAPGKSTIVTSDSQRLRRMHDDNERDAIKNAFAIMSPEQVEKAKRILRDRGIDIPGEKPQGASRSSDDGQPLPGMEP